MIIDSLTTDTRFELRILGYHYPEIEHEEYDSNWLVIGIKVRSPGGDWDASDAALLTWESHWLLTWFDDILAQRKCEPELDFLEPCIRFNLLKATESLVDLQISLGYDLRPPKAVHSDPDEIDIPVQVSADAFRNAIADLGKQVRSFPIRAGRTCVSDSSTADSCEICAG